MLPSISHGSYAQINPWIGVWGLGFRVWDLRLGVQGLGFRV
jgi:hypothetical protein